MIAPAATVQAPPPALMDMAFGYARSQALYVAVKLGLADQLAERPKRSAELAQEVGAHPGALYRLLRGLESMGLVSEPEPDLFALTPLGEHLQRDAPSGLYVQVLMLNDQLSWRGWGELSYTIRTGQSSIPHVFGMSTFEYMQQRPEQAAIFNQAMSQFVGSMAQAVVAAYDFSRFKTLVDVGGGEGLLMASILQANPALRGIVFDLPHSVSGAQRRMHELGLSERCECLGGDFFASVPGGDGIILSAVISDWNDEQSVQILSNCRRAIAPEGRLLLLERLLVPEEPAPPSAFMDLHMLVMGGGTGRSEAEYRRLYERAGFELLRVIPTGTQRSIFEGRPA